MRVQSIILHHIAIPLHEPFRISNGAIAIKDAILVELKTIDGIIAYGEASPMSGAFYSSETPESTWKYLEEKLIPALLSQPEITIRSAVDCINQFPDEPFARAGLEGAVWDAFSKSQHTTLYAMLGGSNRKIPSGVGIGLFDTIDELLQRVETYLSDGYVRTKIKIMPGWDVEPLTAIRKRFGNIPLMVDANASYDLREHRTILKSLDAFDLMMIEQPLPTEAFEDLAELQRSIRTPICVDESAHSMETLEKIISLGSAKIVNIKIQRVGGLANARAMAERAMRAGLPCWLGTMPELGIASMQGIHLATHPAFTFPTDVEASARWYVEDIIVPEIGIDEDGMLAVGEIVVDGEVMGRRSVRMKSFRAN